MRRDGMAEMRSLAMGGAAAARPGPQSAAPGCRAVRRQGCAAAWSDAKPSVAARRDGRGAQRRSGLARAALHSNAKQSGGTAEVRWAGPGRDGEPGDRLGRAGMERQRSDAVRGGGRRRRAMVCGARRWAGRRSDGKRRDGREAGQSRAAACDAVHWAALGRQSCRAEPSEAKRRTAMRREAAQCQVRAP